MKTKKILLITTLTFLFNIFLYSQCDCPQLKNAFYNETKITNNGDYTKDVRDFFGNNGFTAFIQEKDKAKGRYKIAIPIEGVEPGFQPDSKISDYDLLKISILNGNPNYYNVGWANYMVSSIMSDAEIEAYHKCYDACTKIGLSVSLVSDNGNKVGLLIKWIDIGEIKDARIGEVIVYGGDVINPINLKEGTLINNEGKVISIRRREGEDLVISINMQEDKGKKYINIPAKSQVAKPKDDCSGDYLNVNINYDSLSINTWNNCTEVRKIKLTTQGNDPTTNTKYNNLKNMLYALTSIKEIKNNISQLLTDPNKNKAEIFLLQAKLETLETQFNTERTAYIENSNLSKPCNTCYGMY